MLKLDRILPLDPCCHRHVCTLADGFIVVKLNIERQNHCCMSCSDQAVGVQLQRSLHPLDVSYSKHQPGPS